MLLFDLELWACAKQFMRQQGGQAPLHVAGRIGELASVGDVAGVNTWKAIVEHVD